MREIVTVLVLCVLVALCIPLADANIWLALAVYLFLVGAFIFLGIREIPADPPHKGVLTFCGMRLSVVLEEGWNFLPLYPLFNFILIKVEKENCDLNPQVTRTPDRAEMEMRASITYTPGIKGRPESFLTFLNSGGKLGIEKIFGEVAEDRMKTWIGSNNEGPSTWMEALVLRDDAHATLCRAIMGDALTPVNSPIPTSAWMRFFSTPQLEPTEYDVRHGWASKSKRGKWNWDGLQAIFDSDADKKGLKARVEQRRKDVRKLREARGDFGIEHLGITLVRFSVPEIKVIGAVADAADLAEAEAKEKEADKVEADNFSQRIKDMMSDHPKMSLEDATRIVLVTLGKVDERILRVIGAATGLGQDALAALGLQGMPLPKATRRRKKNPKP